MLPEENKIYLADCLKFLKTMPDKSVDLFILDPPYYKVVSQEWDKQWFTIEEYINWCKGWLFEVGRVSKWSTSVWLFGFSYQLIQLFSILTDNGFFQYFLYFFNILYICFYQLIIVGLSL